MKTNGNTAGSNAGRGLLPPRNDHTRLPQNSLAHGLIATVLIASLSCYVHADSDPALLNLSIGEEGLDRSLNNATRYGIEYRFKPLSFHRIVPSIGNVWIDNGATFTYVEMRRDFQLAEKWLLTPSFGVGGFHSEPGLRLGHSMEFRSGIELSHRFDNQFRLGLAIFHLSNGGLSRDNPGTESLVFSVSIPFSTSTKE